MPRYTCLSSPRCTSLKKSGKKKKNQNPSDCHSRKYIWFWFLLLNYVRWEKENSQSETAPPWKTPWDTESKHTIYKVTLYKKHTHFQNLFEKIITFSPFNRKRRAEKNTHTSTSENLCPVSGGSLGVIWIHSIQIYGTSINFLFLAARSFVSINPLAKRREEWNCQREMWAGEADLPSQFPRVDDRPSACRCLNGLRVEWGQILNLGNFI